MNITYKTIGQHVLVIDLDQPDGEPRFVEGNERQRAFEMGHAYEAPRTRLCKCVDGCEKYFTSMFQATLCGDCEASMRSANHDLDTYWDAVAQEQEEEPTNHQGLNAHELGVCADDCNHCNYAEYKA